MPSKPEIQWLVKDVEIPHFLDFRNLLTWTSACIRGERAVVLHKPRGEPTPPISRDMQEVLNRLEIGPDGSIDAEKIGRFGDYSHGPKNAIQEDHGMPTFVMSKSLETGFRDLRFHWKKVVGEGGFGLATLWEVEFEDGHREDVIIKMGVRPDMDLHTEAEWHDRYSLGSRIVQARDLVALAAQHRQGGRFSRGERFDAMRENVLVLEYMRLGNLYSIFEKAATIQRHFPSNALWQLWESLVLGVAEVAYLKVLREQFDQGLSDMYWSHFSDGPDSFEDFLALLETLPISHDVHLDLEESNVLVSQNEQGQYIFKLHDFGPEWSREMRKGWDEWREDQYWCLRSMVKPGKGVPEQNVKEWDSLTIPDPNGPARFTSEDFDDPEKTRVAGRYGSWTNVFTIAKTLETAITLHQFVHPLTAKKINPGDSDVTYGWRAHPADHPNIDSKLISIVLRCMRENPSRRDSVIQLLRDIAQARAEGKMETNGETGDFWENVMQPVRENMGDGGGRVLPAAPRVPLATLKFPPAPTKSSNRKPARGADTPGDRRRRKLRLRRAQKPPSEDHSEPTDYSGGLRVHQGEFKIRGAAERAKKARE